MGLENAGISQMSQCLKDHQPQNIAVPSPSDTMKKSQLRTSSFLWHFLSEMGFLSPAPEEVLKSACPGKSQT